jgi:hypothetical protein
MREKPRDSDRSIASDRLVAAARVNTVDLELKTRTSRLNIL